MKKKILISVIIPNYNRSKSGLITAIKSALNQSFKPHEILVCDDGSTDDSYKQVKKINNPIVKFIHCGRNKRPSIPRNIGILQSTGNWIAFLDSDDFWYEDKLEKQVQIIKEKNKKFISTNAHINTSSIPYINEACLEIDKKDLINTNNIINSSVLISKDILIQKKGFPEHIIFRAIEDYLLWFKISFVSKIYFINEPLLVYNQEGDFRISPRNKIIQFIQSTIILFYFLFYSILNNDQSTCVKIIKNYFIRMKNNLVRNFFFKKKNSIVTNKDKVSILMPVFNAENYLNDSIKSILNQNYNNYELIIIDDSSTDRSIEIINFYKNLSKKIRVFKNKKRLGVAKSLNKILKKTTGTFIARMDADDISNPNRINYQLNLLKNKKVDFLSSGIEYFGENNNKKNTIKFHRPSLNSYETKTRLLFYNPINHPTVFFKKSIIKNIIFDPKHESFEDWSCWIKLIDTNIKMLCSPTVLVKYRKHLKNNSLKNSNKKDKEITMIIKKILNTEIYSLNFILKNDNYLKKYVKEINDYKKINFNKDQLFLLNLYYNLINNRYNYFSSIKSFKEIIFIIKIIFNRKFMKQLV